MKNTFYRPDGVEIEQFYVIIAELRKALAELNEGSVSKEEAYEFVTASIGQQIEIHEKGGFWGLVNPKETPSDARVRYFYMPTYLMTAILMKTVLVFPEVETQVVGFHEALEKGLKASCGRKLQGSGLDAEEGMCKALEVFMDGGLVSFLQRYRDYCEEFNLLVEGIIEAMSVSLKAGKVIVGMGADYTSEYESVVERFRGWKS